MEVNVKDYALEDFVPLWQSGVPPQERVHDEVYFRLTIPKIATVMCRVTYEYARGAYILEFLEKRDSRWYLVNLYTEPMTVLLIRKYIRWRLGIRYIPSLKRIGDDTRSLPAPLPVASSGISR